MHGDRDVVDLAVVETAFLALEDLEGFLFRADRGEASFREPLTAAPRGAIDRRALRGHGTGLSQRDSRSRREDHRVWRLAAAEAGPPHESTGRCTPGIAAAVKSPFTVLGATGGYLVVEKSGR